MSKIKENAHKCFLGKKELKEVHATTDGMCFPTAELARSHTFDLPVKEREIEVVTRQGLADEKAKNTADKSAKAEAKIKTEANKTAIANGDAGVDLVKATIAEVTEWAAKQTDVKVLETALKTVDTVGGKTAVENKIVSLKTVG